MSSIGSKKKNPPVGVPEKAELNKKDGKSRLPPHRKVIQDAANLKFDDSITESSSSMSNMTISEDYETSKVKRKGKLTDLDLEKQCVLDLNKWDSYNSFEGEDFDL